MTYGTEGTFGARLLQRRGGNVGFEGTLSLQTFLINVFLKRGEASL